MHSVILQAATRIVLGLILLFSIYVLFRGHNDPGGGFIGALVASVGFAMFKYAYGTEMVRQSLYIDPRFIAISGLLMSMLSGMLAVFYGKPFLTGIWLLAYVQGKSNWPISTVLFFDIGVYLSVLGTVLTLLLALEEDV